MKRVYKVLVVTLVFTGMFLLVGFLNKEATKVEARTLRAELIMETEYVDEFEQQEEADVTQIGTRMYTVTADKHIKVCYCKNNQVVIQSSNVHLANEYD